jgi:hypothetical protein
VSGKVAIVGANRDVQLFANHRFTAKAIGPFLELGKAQRALILSQQCGRKKIGSGPKFARA